MAAASEPLFLDLWKRYGEQHRVYHTRAHLADVLALVARLAAALPAADPETVSLAAWFHDAVYDPRGGDNEEQSAGLAATQLPMLGLPAATVEEVERLILLTQGHDRPENDDNGAVLLDADLAILGAAPDKYAAYAAAIRREYSWAEEERYRRERTRILVRFLQRPRIYRTEPLWREREEQARANLQWEIATLNPQP